MTTSTYSTAAIDLMDSINLDVRSVLGDEAERIAYTAGSSSVQPEHILEALQRVIRMLQSQQGETKHRFPKDNDSIHCNRLKGEYIIHDLPTTEHDKPGQEAALV